mmetsp:Transcript_83281/g.257436  ORF Transcript_83281/g.257436 Transcript_83281/m.257436 type:complete len:422 (-) Transcript_83281:387-1652(-)
MHRLRWLLRARRGRVLPGARRGGGRDGAPRAPRSGGWRPEAQVLGTGRHVSERDQAAPEGQRRRSGQSGNPSGQSGAPSRQSRTLSGLDHATLEAARLDDRRAVLSGDRHLCAGPGCHVGGDHPHVGPVRLRRQHQGRHRVGVLLGLHAVEPRDRRGLRAGLAQAHPLGGRCPLVGVHGAHAGRGGNFPALPPGLPRAHGRRGGRVPPHHPAAARELGPRGRALPGAGAGHLGHYRGHRRRAPRGPGAGRRTGLAQRLHRLRGSRPPLVRRLDHLVRGRPGRGRRRVRALRVRVELGDRRGPRAELERGALAAAAGKRCLPRRRGLRDGAQHRPAPPPVLAADLLRPVLRPGNRRGLDARRAAVGRLLRAGQRGRLGGRRAHHARRGAARRPPGLPARRLAWPRVLPPGAGRRRGGQRPRG